jgi:PAS domain S-box-containing protein
MPKDELEGKIDLLERRSRELRDEALRTGGKRADALDSALSELGTALEELQVASEELRQQNDELVASSDRLARERQRLRQLFEGAPYAYLITDQAGKIREVNQAGVALFGLKKDLLVGKPIAAFVPTDERKEFRARLSQAAKSPERVNWDMPLSPRGRPVLDAEITVAPRRGKAESSVELLWMIQDVTLRQRAQDSLRQSEERFRSVAEMLPIPVSITRREDGRILYGNPAYARILGLPLTKLIGRKASEFYAHAEDRTRMLAQLEESGLVEGIELECKRADGSPFWAVSSIAAITFGGKDAVASAFRDVTEPRQLREERKRLLAQTAEMADSLQAERDLLETVMESTDAQLVYLDREFNFVLVNSAYAQGSGYSAEQFIGQNHFQLFPNEENQAIFERVRDTGQAIQFRARPFVFPERPDLGTTYWDWTLVPVAGEAGEVQGLVLSLMDVTEHERMLRQLQQERARLAAIIDHAPEAIVVVDDECRVVTTNPVADRLYGGTIPCGERWGTLEQLNLCHADGAPYDPHDLPLARAALEGKSSDNVEMALARPNGSRRDLLASTAPIRDIEGRLTGAVGVFQDITERKRTRESLRLAVERLQLLHDLDSVILTAPPLEQVVQSALERLPLMVPCLRASVSLFDPRDGEFSLLAVFSDGETQLEKGWRGALDSMWFIEELRAGKTHLIQDLQLNDHPAPKWALLREEGIRSYLSVPLVAEGILLGSLNCGLGTADGLAAGDLEIANELAKQLAVAVHQDRLREQVRLHTEELEELVDERTAQLRASEARFRAVFEGTAIGVALLDLEGRIQEGNPALYEMLGYSVEDLRNKPVSLVTHPLDAATGAEGYREFVAGAEDHATHEVRFVRSDGEVRWARLTLSLVRSVSGEPQYTIAVIQDITEEKEAVEGLIQAEKLAITGRLAASLAHEINNPLQAVIGCLGLAQEALEEDGKTQQYLEVGLSELRRAADVVGRLRDVQRMSEPGEKKPMDIRSLLNNAMTVTRKKCEEHDVESGLRCPTGLPTVTGDSSRLQQVFLNLILNAVDAMADGGELAVTARETFEPHGVSVHFADTGPGIDAHIMDHLFDPFVTTKKDGLGLGLYVSQTIVEEHGGRISAESPPDGGAVFTVWLPC